MYYTKMRWHMTGLMAAYFFTLGYGLRQLHLFQLLYFPLYLLVAGALLGFGIFSLRKEIPITTQIRTGLLWAWCNLIFLNLLLWVYTDTSKYLN